MKRRVVVTGMGAITPIGNSVEEFWDSVKKEQIGFAPISTFDTTDYKCKLAAEVKNFKADEYMDKKAARRMEAFCQYAVAAAKEAIEDSGINMENEDPYRVGCAVGSGVGSLQAMEREHTRLVEKGPSKVGILLVPLMITNMAAGNVSINHLRNKRHCCGLAYMSTTLTAFCNNRISSTSLHHFGHCNRSDYRYNCNTCVLPFIYIFSGITCACCNNLDALLNYYFRNIICIWIKKHYINTKRLIRKFFTFSNLISNNIRRSRSCTNYSQSSGI